MTADRPAVTLTSEITVRPIQQVGGDHMIVAAAKVSTTGEAALGFADPGRSDDNFGLINFLMKHRHGSPFEHGLLTFFVHAPIFVFREWHRHRIASYSEESARYKRLEPVFWIPRRDRPMVPVEGWKPGRPKFLTLDDYHWTGVVGSTDARDLADQHYAREVERDREVYQLAYDRYLDSLDDGIAMEVARSKLTLAIYSSCWVTCNPRSLMNLLSLRVGDDEATYRSYPQAEIEEAARACEAVFEAGWPLSHRAFVANGRVAP